MRGPRFESRARHLTEFFFLWCMMIFCLPVIFKLLFTLKLVFFFRVKTNYKSPVLFTLIFAHPDLLCMSLNPLTYRTTATCSKGPPCLQLIDFSCGTCGLFVVIGQFGERHHAHKCWAEMFDRNQNTNFVRSC